MSESGNSKKIQTSLDIDSSGSIANDISVKQQEKRAPKRKTSKPEIVASKQVSGELMKELGETRRIIEEVKHFCFVFFVYSSLFIIIVIFENFENFEFKKQFFSFHSKDGLYFRRITS